MPSAFTQSKLTLQAAQVPLSVLQTGLPSLPAHCESKVHSVHDLSAELQKNPVSQLSLVTQGLAQTPPALQGYAVGQE